MPAEAPYSASIACSLRAPCSVTSPFRSTISTASAATSAKAARWCRKAKAMFNSCFQLSLGWLPPSRDVGRLTAMRAAEPFGFGHAGYSARARERTLALELPKHIDQEIHKRAHELRLTLALPIRSEDGRRFQRFPVRKRRNEQTRRQVPACGKVGEPQYASPGARRLVKHSPVFAQQAAFYVHRAALPVLFEDPTVKQDFRRAAEEQAMMTGELVRLLGLSLASPVLRGSAHDITGLGERSHDEIAL